jgi:hypothetical protein
MVITGVFSDRVQAQESLQNMTFVVVGSARVRAGNVQAAREAAIKEGLVTAVARMTEEILKVEAMVDNFPQVNELVYEQTDKYVQNYKVLTETASSSGKVYRVVVQATVAGQKIAKQLSNEGILRVKTTLPTVLFLIAEQNVKEILPQFWWGVGMGNFQSVSEQAAVELFKAKGFTVIAHNDVRLQQLVDWTADAIPELTDMQAIELGSNLKADVVVIGTASASESSNIMGYETKSFNGVFTTRVLRTETADEMLALQRDAVATNVDEYEGGVEALSNVGVALGEVLAEQLASEWRKLLEKPSQIEIAVEGTRQLANFVKFRKALSSISGVEGIQVKEIRPNEATLIVDFQGKAEDLAAALMLKTFETFGIDIYEIAENSLKIALISG